LAYSCHTIFGSWVLLLPATGATLWLLSVTLAGSQSAARRKSVAQRKCCSRIYINKIFFSGHDDEFEAKSNNKNIFMVGSAFKLV
jgi:hypothetical protein